MSRVLSSDESLVAECLELQPAFDRQGAAILGLLLQLARPRAVGKQLLLERGERRAGHGGRQQLFLALAERLVARIAVELFAAAVPRDDAAVELPYEDRIARELDQLLLLAQLPLALPRGFLNVTALGHVDERDDDAVDTSSTVR